MGETLTETRLEVEAQRAQLQQTANRLEARVRWALDVPARFRENPLLFVAVGAGAAFLVAGGPVRLARVVRRRLRPTTTELAYEALPKAMQAWVDSVAGGVGPRAAAARHALAEELQRWRMDAPRSKKARRELAKALAEGPPGPERATWKAVEAGLTLVTAALARKAVERFITGGPVEAGPTGGQSLLARQRARRAPPEHAAPEPRSYSGFSTVGRSDVQ